MSTRRSVSPPAWYQSDRTRQLRGRRLTLIAVNPGTIVHGPHRLAVVGLTQSRPFRQGKRLRPARPGPKAVAILDRSIARSRTALRPAPRSRLLPVEGPRYVLRFQVAEAPLQDQRLQPGLGVGNCFGTSGQPFQ